MPTTADTFAATLRRLRARCGITQATLAKRAGVSPSFIMHMEAGRKPPNIEAMVKLARALNVPVRALVEDFDPPVEASPRSEE